MPARQWISLPGLLLLAVALMATDEPAADKGKPRTDADGDPLPVGVVARLGSARLIQGNVEELGFSPNDDILAARSYDGHLYLWDVRAGTEIHSFWTPGHNLPSPFAFSPDSKLIAFAHVDKSVRICETVTGKERDKTVVFSDAVNQLVFDPSGNSIAMTCDNDSRGPASLRAGSIHLWNLEKKTARTLATDLRVMSFLAYSSDGKKLTAIGPQYAVPKKVTYQWDTDSGKEVLRHNFEIEQSYRFPALSSDGTLFAAPSHDGTVIRLLDPTTGKEKWQAEGKPDSPLNVAFSMDGKLLTGGGRNGKVQVWDTATGKLQHEFKALDTGSILHVALSHDGKLVTVTGESDYAIHLFDVGGGKELHSCPGHRGGPLTVAFSADGKNVVTVNRAVGRDLYPRASSLRTWDAQTGKELRITPVPASETVHHTAFSPDGRIAATVSHRGTLRLWDIDTGKELRSWKVPTDETTQPAKRPPIGFDAIYNVAFSDGGNTLAASTGIKVFQWDTATGDKRATLDVPDDSSFTYVQAGPDQQSLLVSARPTRPDRPVLYVLDTAAGHVGRPIGTSRFVGLACLSPDGRTVAYSEHRDGAKTFGVVLGEVVTGRERGRFLDADLVYGLAFSPDGKLLAVGGDDVVRLFHLASGREVARLDAYRGKPESLAFSPDGKWLAVAGSANTALVCDVAVLTAGKVPAPAKLTAKDLDALWDDVRHADDAEAYRAVGRLAASAKESLPYLKDRLKEDVDGPRIARLIADLDDSAFDVRKKAVAALQDLGPAAEPALRRALETTESAEVRARARELLGKLKDPDALPAAVLAKLRALEAVANMETPEARALLKELAQGEAKDRLTQEAKAALKRMDDRKKT